VNPLGGGKKTGRTDEGGRERSGIDWKEDEPFRVFTAAIKARNRENSERRGRWGRG